MKTRLLFTNYITFLRNQIGNNRNNKKDFVDNNERKICQTLVSEFNMTQLIAFFFQEQARSLLLTHSLLSLTDVNSL